MHWWFSGKRWVRQNWWWHFLHWTVEYFSLLLHPLGRSHRRTCPCLRFTPTSTSFMRWS